MTICVSARNNFGIPGQGEIAAHPQKRRRVSCHDVENIPKQWIDSHAGWVTDETEGQIENLIAQTQDRFWT